MQHTDDNNRQPSIPIWCVALVLLAPVLYFLSLGPIVWLHRRYHPFEGWSMTVVSAYVVPAEFAIEVAPEGGRKAMESYLSLWE